MYVLVVDDNPLMRELIERFLTQLGYQVQAAASAAEALQLAAANPPTLALVDIHLPDQQGDELLVALRELAGCSELHAVAMSGADEADLRRLGTQPQTTLLTKPIELDLLQTIVAQHLGKTV